MVYCSSSAFWKLTSICLGSLLLLQWFIVSLVLIAKQGQEHSATPILTILDDAHPTQPQHGGRKGLAVPMGVAVTLMLRAPKWFHRRYTLMLHNVLVNIPEEDWMVQIFVNTAWLERDVLPLHPGLAAMYQPPGRETSWTVGRIIWTPLPSTMIKSKPKDIMKSVWFWESIVAENILLFGGNGAICANANASIQDFIHWDYVGTPWSLYHGQGGDGSTHSFRHRSAMLSVLKHNNNDNNNKSPRGDHPDYQFFLQHMILEQDKYKIADKQTTMHFGGVMEADRAPFLLSGTQATLNWTQRENLLSACPEIKMIFPSMHEPACFGAHPDPVKCKKSICVLRDVIPPQGC